MPRISARYALELVVLSAEFEPGQERYEWMDRRWIAMMTAERRLTLGDLLGMVDQLQAAREGVGEPDLPRIYFNRHYGPT